MAKEKLTKVYGILVRDDKGETYNYPIRKDVSDGIFWGYCQKELTEDQAKELLLKLENENKPAKAYHYGFRERGFRVGETECETLAVNKLW